MRVSRALIVALALMVSPTAASVCEVVCGMGPHAAHQAVAAPAAVVASAHDAHAHHTPQPAPVTVSASSPDGVSMSIPAPECDLRGASPARLRSTSTDVIGSAAAITTSAYFLDDTPSLHLRVAGTTASPPAPPPLTPLPLRI